MKLQVAFCLVALAAGLAGWLCWDLQTMDVYWNFHSFLVDKTTGVKTESCQLIDLARLYRPNGSYVNSTDAIERLYDRVYQNNIESGFSMFYEYSNPQQIRQSGWPLANQTKCGLQLEAPPTRFLSLLLLPGAASRLAVNVPNKSGVREADLGMALVLEQRPKYELLAAD